MFGKNGVDKRLKKLFMNHPTILQIIAYNTLAQEKYIVRCNGYHYSAHVSNPLFFKEGVQDLSL